jgi:phosphatidylglycerophosphate synthase
MAAPLPFGERLRRFLGRHDDDWWCIVFCAPVAAFLNACIAEVRWITPNALTLAAFAVRLGVLPLILAGSRTADLLAAIGLTVATILDCMDGGLARYRRTSSLTGAFLDKSTDVIGLCLVCAVLGLRVFRDTGSILGVYAALFIAGSYASRCYNYWIVAYFELERQDAKATAGPRSLAQPASESTFGERVGYMLRSSWRILILGESDVYLWLGLGLAVGALRTAVLAVAAGMACWFVIFLGWRLVAVVRLDR